VTPSGSTASEDVQHNARPDENHRIALITGASRGIGRATALALAQSGFAVVLAARDERRIDEVAAGIERAGGIALPVCCDVTNETSVRALFNQVYEQFDRLDLLFNNAGTSAGSAPTENMTLDDWNLIVSTNLTGAFLCTREAFRLMRTQQPRGGRIINNGSVSAYVPRPNSAAYTASKHAIAGLTKATSLDGRRFDIACGQIDLGNVTTPESRDAFVQREQADGSFRNEPTITGDDVARAIVYMASLPLEANVQFMTVMATSMPLLGRGYRPTVLNNARLACQENCDERTNDEVLRGLPTTSWFAAAAGMVPQRRPCPIA